MKCARCFMDITGVPYVIGMMGVTNSGTPSPVVRDTDRIYCEDCGTKVLTALGLMLLPNNRALNDDDDTAVPDCPPKFDIPKGLRSTRKLKAKTIDSKEVFDSIRKLVDAGLDDKVISTKLYISVQCVRQVRASSGIWEEFHDCQGGTAPNIDYGKIRALIEAGWFPSDIAENTGTDIKIVQEIYERYISVPDD